MPLIRSSSRSSNRSRSRSFRGGKKRSSRRGKVERKENPNDGIKFKIYQLPENSSDPGSIEVVESSSKWATKYDTEETCSYEDSYGSETQRKSAEGCDISKLMAAYKTTTDFVHNIEEDDDETADWFLNTLHSSDSFNISKRSNRKLRMVGGHLTGGNNDMLNDLVPLAWELDAISCQKMEEEVVFCEDTSSDDKQLSISTNAQGDETCSITNDAIASLCITPRAQQKLLTKERQKKKDLLGDCITNSSSEEIEFNGGSNGGGVDEVMVVDAVVKALRKSKRKKKSEKVSTDVMDVLKSLERMDNDLNNSHQQNGCPKENGDEAAMLKQNKLSTEHKDDLTLERLGLIGDIDSFSIDAFCDNSVADEDPELMETTTKSLEKTTCIKFPLQDEKLNKSFTDLSSPSVDITASITSLSSSDDCHIPTPPQLTKETIRIPPLQKTKKKMMSWKKKEFSVSSFTENESTDNNRFSYLAFNKIIQHGKKEKNNEPRKENSLRRSRKLYSSFSFAKQDRTPNTSAETTCKPSEAKSRKVHWGEQQLVNKEEKGLLTSISIRKFRSIRFLEKHMTDINSVQNVETTPNHGYIC